jgi:hypothetical protein
MGSAQSNARAAEKRAYGAEFVSAIPVPSLSFHFLMDFFYGKPLDSPIEDSKFIYDIGQQKERRAARQENKIKLETKYVSACPLLHPRITNLSLLLC